MKKKLLSLFLAVTMAVSTFSTVSFARYTSENNTYTYKSTTDLEASIDDQKVVLTWPAVDTEGNLINANPLKAEGQLMSTGNPTAGWTNPTQGMIIEYSGWLPDGSHNSVANDNKPNHNVLMGVVDTPTEYPIVIKDPHPDAGGAVVKNAYVDTTVVATSLATAYQIQYSTDGVNWTEDHIASTFNHGKKLTRINADGTYSDDAKNTFFLEDQITEAVQATLQPETLYYIRVNAFNGSVASSKNTPYKTFETTITTPAEEKPLAPAFPSVEGGGTYSVGGRGSVEQPADVYVVTNLTDSVSNPQPGSLRYGLERRDRADGNKAYPRIITFAVGGTIEVDPEASKSARRFNITDNTTILGQTAPGEGITLYGASVKFSGKNIIARYLRVKLGEGYDLDAATASGENIVIDHCTFNWGVDECFTAKELVNSSIQYNIIANSLAMVNKNGVLNSDVEIASGESEAKHGMGSIINGYETTFTHNLYANNGTRNPRFEGGFTYNNVNYDNKLQFSNNVIYNWGHNTGYGGERGNGLVNFTDNYHKSGPNTIEKVKNYLFDPDGLTSKYYIEGNVLEGNSEVTQNNIAGFPNLPTSCILSSPVELANPYTSEDAEAAYENVLANVGASKTRDAQDERLIANVKNGGGNFINSEFEDGGVDTDTFVSTELDSDNDGIPDTWEDAKGLNKNDASDASAIILDETSADYGYTNIEAYANSLCEDRASYHNIKVDSLTLNDVTSDYDNVSYMTVMAGESFTVTPASSTAFESYSVKANDVVIAEATNSNPVTASISEEGRYYVSAKVNFNNNSIKEAYSPVVIVTVVSPDATENLEGFTATEVGAVRLPGQDNYNPNDGTLISQGSGHIGILATMGAQDPDAFHFNYKEMTGNVSLVAQIDNMAKLDYWQHSGLMIRGSLDTDSEFYMATLTYIKGEDYEGSIDVAGNTVKAKNIGVMARRSAGASIEYPYYKYLGVPQTRAGEEPNHGWAKIEKIGQTVTLSASLDGTTWYVLNSYETTLPETFYIGFATDGAQEYCDFTRYNTTKFSNISLTELAADPTGDVNADSNVNFNDAILILRSSAGTVELTPEQKFEADLNTDGNINFNDAILVLRKAAGN